MVELARAEHLAGNVCHTEPYRRITWGEIDVLQIACWQEWRTHIYLFHFLTIHEVHFADLRLLHSVVAEHLDVGLAAIHVYYDFFVFHHKRRVFFLCCLSQKRQERSQQ